MISFVSLKMAGDAACQRLNIAELTAWWNHVKTSKETGKLAAAVNRLKTMTASPSPRFIVTERNGRFYPYDRAVRRIPIGYGRGYEDELHCEQVCEKLSKQF